MLTLYEALKEIERLSARVDALLEANTKEVERRRAAEATADSLSVAVYKLSREQR